MGKKLSDWKTGEMGMRMGYLPPNSPIPIIPKRGNGEGWDWGMSWEMGMGGPISIPIPQCSSLEMTPNKLGY